MSLQTRALLWCAVLIFSLASPVLAQDTSQDTSNDNASIFPHSDTSRIYIAGQMNFIHQQHPGFPAKYSGENSLRPEREKATSRLMTLYTGLELGDSTELLVDIESAGGQGLSSALGLAGFTNLDVVRNPTLGSKPYLGRLMWHQTISLGEEVVPSQRNFLSLATQRPERRLEFRVGKMSIADFFDVNAIGSDSHLQFMNWTVDNNGGYDYAADTRGYTFAGVAEYHSRNSSLRFAEALMPKVANGINLDWNLRRARAENIEVEIRPPLVRNHGTTFRLLSYVNHANMGSYREAIDAFLAGHDPVPDIEAHRRQGRVKYGFGFNAEQEVVHDVRAFARAGWNEGHNESFAYTEVNGTVALGGDAGGKTWHRANDKLGIAFVHNGISGDHRRYLQLGGTGFLLGDGTLTYGREKIFETYYTARIKRGIYVSLDLQHISNPGYNRDRGPVIVPGIRLHLDF